MLHGGDGLELLLLAGIALMVVGPKDLPVLLRKLGQFVGKMRGMAAEFRASFDEMARQSELDELRKEVEAMRQGQFADQAARATGTEGVSQIFHEIGDSLGEVQLHPPMSHQYDAAAMVASSEPAVVETAPKARAARARPATKPKTTRPTVTRPTSPKAVAAKVPAAKAPVRAKAAAVAKPAKAAKPVAKPKAPRSAPAAKMATPPAPRAPVQRAPVPRAKSAAKPKAGSRK